MKTIAEMNLQELAAFVCSHLQRHDIPVVLVGGSCVSIYSDNHYQTADLDFVERYHTKRTALNKALAEIGFVEENRYFVHPESAWFLEFPTGPLAIGDGPVHELNQVETHGVPVYGPVHDFSIATCRKWTVSMPVATSVCRLAWTTTCSSRCA